MDFKDYLLNECPIDLSIIAGKMWPTNKNAKSYLSMKLNDNAGRTWTAKDNALAQRVINDMGEELCKLGK